MPEYKLIVNEDGTIILNEEGEAVDMDTALSLLDLLHERYERPACVYVVRSAAMQAYKIGWSGQKIENRVSQIRYAVGGWQGVELEFTIPCSSSSEARNLETQLHSRFAEKNLYGEWFNLSMEDVDVIFDIAFPGFSSTRDKVNHLIFGVASIEHLPTQHRAEAALRAQWLADYYSSLSKQLKGGK